MADITAIPKAPMLENAKAFFFGDGLDDEDIFRYDLDYVYFGANEEPSCQVRIYPRVINDSNNAHPLHVRTTKISVNSSFPVLAMSNLDPKLMIPVALTQEGVALSMCVSAYSNIEMILVKQTNRLQTTPQQQQQQQQQ